MNQQQCDFMGNQKGKAKRTLKALLLTDLDRVDLEIPARGNVINRRVDAAISFEYSSNFQKMEKMENENELLSLTGLRFVAAFYVFVFHIHISWPLTNIKYLKNIFDQGAIGMSLFFIFYGFAASTKNT